MSTRISNATLAALLLSGCAASLVAPDRALLDVNGQEVMVAAPDGLCIDPRSIDVTRAGGFLLIGDCAVLGAETGRPVNAVITASVSTGGLPGTLEDLRAFLTGPGEVTLGKSGGLEKVRALSSRIAGDVLYVKVEDRGEAPVPGASQTFWRAFFEVSGRLVGASVVGFEAVPTSDRDARALLASLAGRTRAANNAPADGS